MSLVNGFFVVVFCDCAFCVVFLFQRGSIAYVFIKKV